jgi:hypothetical protein
LSITRKTASNKKKVTVPSQGQRPSLSDFWRARAFF